MYYYREAFRAIRTAAAVQHSLLQYCAKITCPCCDRAMKMYMQANEIKVMPKPLER